MFGRRKQPKNRRSRPTLAACAVILAGCSSSTPRWEPPRTGAVVAQTAKATNSGGRWLLLPEYVDSQSHILEPTGAELIIAQGLRIEDSPDGSLAASRQLFPSAQVSAIKLPTRLGGGFVFYKKKSGETPIWRSETFTDELTPLVSLTERVQDIIPGFDRIYVQLERGHELVALDPRTGKVLDLGPLPHSPSFRSLAFASEWSGVVSTDILGLLVSYDAGGSWHTTGLPKGPAKLRVEEDTVVAELGRLRVRLTSSGEIERLGTTDSGTLFQRHNASLLADVANEPKTATGNPTPLGARPLRDAVLYGAKFDHESAVVANLGGLGQVRLSDGKLLRFRPAAYPGVLPCTAVPLGAGVGFVCSEPEQGTQIYRLRANFSLENVASFSTPRAVSASGNGRLVVKGRCENAATAPESDELQPYCVLWFEGANRELQGRESRPQAKKARGAEKPEKAAAPGVAQKVSSKEIRVRGDIGAERVVSLSDGRIAVLIPPRLGTPGSLNIVGKETQQVPVQLKPEDNAHGLLSRGLWMHGVQQVSPTELATWVVAANSYVGVRISLSGEVESAPYDDSLDIEKTVIGGRFALDVSTGQETENFGFDWSELNLPENLSTLSPKDELKPRASRPVVGCSSVGCSYGAWLRIGRGRGPGEPEQEEQLAAPTPKTITFQDSEFSNWRFRCHPTGEVNRSAAKLASESNRAARARPRRGKSVGFTPKGLLASTLPLDIGATGYRHFLAVPGPRVRRDELGFDHGEDRVTQFRAYAWGKTGTAWPKSSAWVFRAANRFDLDSLWSTIPTRTPWSDLESAAKLFGAGRGHRYSTNWRLSLDAEETLGLLRVSSSSSTELHLVEQGKPIHSVTATNIGPPSGIAKKQGTVYFGTQDGTRFRVHELGATLPEQVGAYPLNSVLKAQLVRSSDEQALGILVRSRRGNWHLYPLDDAGRAQPALVFPRSLLNKKASKCGDHALGWLVKTHLPAARLAESTSLNVLQFEGPFKARSVFAKLLLSEDSICVKELAGQLARGSSAAETMKKKAPQGPGSVSLVLTDRTQDRRFGFRCE